MLDAEAAVPVRVPSLAYETVDTTKLKVIAKPRLEVLRIGITTWPVTMNVQFR
jgi:hypothetical protein